MRILSELSRSYGRPVFEVIVPMSGPMPFFDTDSSPFPKPLVEIDGVPMIAYLAANLRTLRTLRRAHFLVREDYCKKYHLDDTIRLLLPGVSNVIRVSPETRGALCTALLCIDELSLSAPVVVMNFDQYFSGDFAGLIRRLLSPQVDGGVAVFESVHPRWSFVKLECDRVVQAVEKRPISRTAIAGIYAFSRSEEFLEAAFSALKNNASCDGAFYISAAINELILRGKVLNAVTVTERDYHTFYSPQRVDEFLRKGIRLSER